MKNLEIKEFREKGYLQELNRRFLHPLGLALCIKVDENGCEVLDSILDYRDDAEGIYYDIKNSDDNRKQKFRDNKEFIDNEIKNRFQKRFDKLGFDIEPIL